MTAYFHVSKTPKNFDAIMIRVLQYFCPPSVNGDILKQLIYEAINLLTEKGAEVSTVIFCGTSKNISMAEKLGRNTRKLETSFPIQVK